MMHNNLFKLCIHTIFYNLFLLFILNFQGISNTASASASSVKFLPGFDGPLPFELETGYIGVGESEDVQLFYYFIKSERNPGKDPLLLWLTGGPGCSALSGLLYEIGPIQFVLMHYHGRLPKLALNPYSWTKVANIIFLDLPVGTGFSYARNTKAAHSDDLQSSDHAYEFLRKWLIEHPQFISNQLYVTGDSYSGITVPILTQLISDGNDIGLEPKINLEGYLLGNPVTCPADGDYVAQFVHGMGLIPDELFESLKETCKGVFHGIDPSNRICLQNMQTLDKLLGNIRPEYILDFNCPIDAPKPNKLLGDTRRIMYEKDHSDLMKLELQKDSPFKCRTDGYRISYQWANDESVQEAIHVRKGTVGQWKRFNHDLSFTKSVINVVPYHANLSIKGYRSLIYSGDHDLIVPFISTEAWIKSLNYSIVDDWRPWNVDGQVAGYTRTYANKMTYATVKGAGHTAPEYMPRECRSMFEKWISYQPL